LKYSARPRVFDGYGFLGSHGLTGCWEPFAEEGERGRRPYFPAIVGQCKGARTSPRVVASALKELLIGSDGPFRGKLLTDGLELYDIVSEELRIERFGCLQHYPARISTRH
jgi:hypothetical protein